MRSSEFHRLHQPDRWHTLLVDSLFLREGKLVVSKTRSKFYHFASSQHLTLPPEMAKKLSDYIAPLNGTFSLCENDLHCEGALVTRDRHIYFWQLLGDTAIELTSPTGEKGILLLRKDNPIQLP